MTRRRDRSWRNRVADWLRFLADRIHEDSAFVRSNLTFHYRDGVGIVVEENQGRGCPLWYLRDEYDLAHEVTVTIKGREYPTSLPIDLTKLGGTP